MALLFLPPSFAGLLLEDVLDDMLSWSDLGRRRTAMRRGCGPAHCRSGAACHRASDVTSPSEHDPELRLTRTSDGVLAECALGREFSEADISLQLEGRELHVTAFQPGTALHVDRPAVFRRTLDLAPHIDAHRIGATLEGGVLTLVFPYLAPGDAVSARHFGGPCDGAAAAQHFAATCGGAAACEQLARRCRGGLPAHMHRVRRAGGCPGRFTVRWADEAGACGGACHRAQHAQHSASHRHTHDAEAGPSQPPSAAAPAPAPALTDPADKGKTPVGEERASDLERHAAGQRVAAGIASDEDWEGADGAVEDCPLEEEPEPEAAAEQEPEADEPRSGSE